LDKKSDKINFFARSNQQDNDGGIAGHWDRKNIRWTQNQRLANMQISIYFSLFMMIGKIRVAKWKNVFHISNSKSINHHLNLDICSIVLLDMPLLYGSSSHHLLPYSIVI
jgi:hypothetical protein